MGGRCPSAAGRIERFFRPLRKPRGFARSSVPARSVCASGVGFSHGEHGAHGEDLEEAGARGHAAGGKSVRSRPIADEPGRTRNERSSSAVGSRRPVPMGGPPCPPCSPCSPCENRIPIHLRRGSVHAPASPRNRLGSSECGRGRDAMLSSRVPTSEDVGHPRGRSKSRRVPARGVGARLGWARTVRVPKRREPPRRRLSFGFVGSARVSEVSAALLLDLEAFEEGLNSLRESRDRVIQRFPRRSCSISRLSKRALKLPFPKLCEPRRQMISKKSVGRSCSGFVKSCSR